MHILKIPCIISLLYESGCRIGELGRLTWGRTWFDEYGVILTIEDTKCSNQRYVRLVMSKPYLSVCRQDYPFESKDDDYTKEKLCATPAIAIPIEEQHEIAAYLDQKCTAIDSVVAKKETLIDKLTEYKKSLIYEAVTGKREVPELCAV